MKCKKLRKIYFKYTDGELSEPRARLVKEHIGDCPDCAAEAESLQKMRSLLRMAGRIELPNTYWDTYWDRLEEKLPDEPSPVTLTSRMFKAFATSLQRPAVLGRIAVYILLLVFLLYSTPENSVKVVLKPQMASQESSELAEPRETSGVPLELQEARKFAEAEEEITLGDRQVAGERADSALPKDKTSDRPVEYAARKEGLELKAEVSASGSQPAGTEKTFAWAEPVKPLTAPEEPLAEMQDDLQDLARSEDEYIAAENYFRNGEYAQAIPAYQNFIEANIKANVDDDRTLRAKYQIGEAYYQIGNYSEALSNFAAVADAGISKGEASRAPAKGTGSQKEDEEKHAVLSERLKAGEEADAKARRPETSRGVTVMYDRMAQQDEVRAGLKPASAETREELISQAIFRQAESYEHLGRREEALAKYKEYVERYPQGKFLLQAKEKMAQIAR